jgi:predicted nucleic acid-binding protein
MKFIDPHIIYWDTSAVISTLFQDEHSEQALYYAGLEGAHLISSLALAETHAVLNRLRRERLLNDILFAAAVESLETGPWKHLKIVPDDTEIKVLGKKWPLCGADLWHLAAAKTLQEEFPELLLLTYDNRLHLAASGEDLAK